MLIEAFEADRVVVGRIIRDILLTSELKIAVEATEMLDVVVFPISKGIFRNENQFIASSASRDLHQLSKITSAVNLIVVMEVDKINQQLRALLALETFWMPLSAFAQTFSFDVSGIDRFNAPSTD